MRILVVSNMYPNKKYPSYGVFVKSFCDSLDSLGIKYSSAVMYKANNKLEKLFRYVIFYITTFFKTLFFRFDIVYVHYASYSSVPVLFARKFKRVKVYTNLHGSDVVPENDKQRKMIKYTRMVLDISDKIIVPSEYFRDYVSDKFGVLHEKIYISHSGGVDSTVFHMHKKDGNSEIFKIGFVGRLSYGKGWKTLLDAIRKLSILNYEVVIVGNGSEEKAMLEYINKYKLGSRIKKFDLLPRHSLAKIYQQLDLFVFPTEREGESLGLVAIEAMACGVPVIASDFAAPAYFVKNYYNGFKFEKGNSAHLASMIEEFYNLPAEKKLKLQDGAISTAREYETNKVTEDLKKILMG